MTADVNLEFVIAIFERMKQVGLVKCKSEFSENYLGHSPSYLTSMTARDRQVPDHVVERLRVQIEATIAAKHSNGNERAEKHLKELLVLTAHHQERGPNMPDVFPSSRTASPIK